MLASLPVSVESLGSDRLVKCSIGGERQREGSFTVMAAITAARTILSLCMMITGKTTLVEQSHFDDVG
jgi:hypothetical protein